LTLKRARNYLKYSQGATTGDQIEIDERGEEIKNEEISSHQYNLTQNRFRTDF
jgi:hypothetical protein